MLYEKNGVITEDRFKNMSITQWIFHYKEIMKNKNKRDKDIHELIDVLFTSLIDKLEFVGTMSNPELASKIFKSRDNNSGKDETSLENDELMSWFEKIKEEVPETMMLDFKAENKNKFFLPKYQRKKRGLGIDTKVAKKVGE